MAQMYTAKIQERDGVETYTAHGIYANKCRSHKNKILEASAWDKQPRRQPVG